MEGRCKIMEKSLDGKQTHRDTNRHTHTQISNVPFRPKFRANAIKIGSLDEQGSKILLDRGFMNIHDEKESY